MIKRVLSIIMIATLLFSCNDTEYNNEGISSSENNAINFSVLQVEASRAVETTTSTLCQDGNKIAVTAIQHLGKSYGSNLSQPLVIMDNVRVTYSGGVWNYLPKAYWPIYADEYATFYSYYPISDNGYNGLTKSVSVSNTGTMSFYLERVADKSIDQDVIYAIESDKTAASSGGTIFFNFKHLLSKLNFKIALNSDDDNRSIRVTSIGLQNYKSCATYQNHYGMIEMVNGSANIDTENLLLLAKTSFEVENGQEVNLESQLMLPQFIDASSCADKSPKIVLEYVVIEADGSETPKSVSYSLENGFDAWNSGYSYNYTLKIDNSAISVDGSVGDFEEGGDAELNPDNPSINEEFDFEPDYVLEVDVAQDNGYAATYFSLDGTEVDGWGKYSDANKYVTTIQDVSVDITSEIESALGLEEGELEDAINAGEVLLGAYGFDENSELCFMDCYERITGNYFYWFDNEGFITTWGNNAYVVVDNIGFHSSQVQLYGTVALFPNDAEIGTTYSGYIVFKTESDEYVVEVKGAVVAEPEEHPLPEFEIVKSYKFEYNVTYLPDYSNVSGIESIEDEMPDIIELLGASPTDIYMSFPDGTYRSWSETDGWFGHYGATSWGSSALFHIKPELDGTFYDMYCFPEIDTFPAVAAVTFRYANSATNKAVDVKVVVTLYDSSYVPPVIDNEFTIDPMGEVVEVAADASTYFTATINCPSGYTLIKYNYDTEWGMINIYSEYQDFWCWVNDDNEGNIEVNFEINETGSPRKAYLFVMPTSAYEALNGDVDGFFVADVNAYVWEMSEQAAQYLIAEFQQEAGEVDDTFEFDPMGEVVEVAADASTYFTATINCPAGYTLVKYNYTEWGMTNIFSEYQEFWCYVEDDNAGNISVSFEANETASARKAYLFAMPTSAYEALNGDVDGFFVADVNADVWEMSEQAAQYLIAEFQQD